MKTMGDMKNDLMKGGVPAMDATQMASMMVDMMGKGMSEADAKKAAAGKMKGKK